MKRQLYLVSLFIWISVLFLSCNSSSDGVDNLLNRAEEQMEVKPDSALSLLQQIPHPDKLQGRQRAAYALLLTQAQDKNYLDSLQSDSLIELAVQYYQAAGDKPKAARACYYYGRTLAAAEKSEEAIQAYLQAQMLLKDSQEYKLQGLIEEKIGMLNYDQRMFDASVENYKRTMDFYHLAQDTLGMVYACRNLARGYMSKYDADSAKWWVGEGLKLLQDTTHRVRPSFFQILGILAQKEKDYPSAIDYFHKAISGDANTLSRYPYYMSLGRAYLSSGQLDEAEKCFTKVMAECNKKYTRAGASNFLCELEKMRGNYKKALFHKEQSDSLLEMVHNQDLQKQFLTLQKKYDNEKLKMENEQIKLEKENMLYLSLMIVSMLIILLFFIRNKYKKRFLSNIDIIRKNESEIEEYAFHLGELTRKSEEEQFAKKSKIADLNRKILLLTTENKELRENTCIKASYVLEQLNTHSLLVQHMTTEERKCLFDFLDLIFANFITRLNNTYSLTKTDLILAALLKVGFSNAQLVFVFDCERNSVYRMKLRLKEHLSLDKEKSLEEFILFF